VTELHRVSEKQLPT